MEASNAPSAPKVVSVKTDRPAFCMAVGCAKVMVAIMMPMASNMFLFILIISRFIVVESFNFEQLLGVVNGSLGDVASTEHLGNFADSLVVIQLLHVADRA